MKEFDPRTSPISGDMSSDRTKGTDGTQAVSRMANEMRVVSERRAKPTVVEQKRKRYTAQQELELVRLTYLPGNTVSSVARSYDIAPAPLFRWRALDKEGGLMAIETSQSTVPVKQYAEAMDEIKRLQRLLEQMASDNALLEEAVEIMKGKKMDCALSFIKTDKSICHVCRDFKPIDVGTARSSLERQYLCRTLLSWQRY